MDRRNCNNVGNVGILGVHRVEARSFSRSKGSKEKTTGGRNISAGLVVLIVQGWPRELLACKVIVFDAVILQCRACTHASRPRAADTSRRSVVITAPVLFLLPFPNSLLSLFRLANRDSYPRHPSAKSSRANNTPLSRNASRLRRFLQRTRPFFLANPLPRDAYSSSSRGNQE